MFFFFFLNELLRVYNLFIAILSFAQIAVIPGTPLAVELKIKIKNCSKYRKMIDKSEIHQLFTRILGTRGLVNECTFHGKA